MGAHRQAANLGLYAILNQGEGVGVWDFKGKEDNSHEDRKTNLLNMFAGLFRDNGTQKGLRSASPAKIPPPHASHILCSCL